MQPSMQQAGSKEWIGLAVLALPTLLVSMDMTILYLAAPSLSATLKPSGSELLWISDIYGFLVAGALIPMGAIGDRVGRRKLLLIGSLFFSIASVLAAFSINAAMLIGARALMGVAGATLLPSTLAMIRNMFHSPQQRSIAIGVWTTCFTLGGVAGPLIGGLLLEHFWWGSVFLIAVPVMAALMALGPVFLPEFREPSGYGIDLVSVAQSVTGVLAITFAVKQAAEHGITIAAATSALLGLGAITLFLRRQRRLAHPLIDLGLFSSPAFTAAIGANTMALFAWVGASFLVAQYFQLVLGMSPFAAGLWSIPPAIACVAGCLGAPALAQRVRSACVVSGALLLAAGGLALLGVAPAPPGLAAIILGMMMLGLGVSTVVTLGTDLVLTAAPAEKAGAASAISETGADIGGSFGVAILGSIGVAIYQRSLVLPAGIDPAATAAARNTLGAAVDVAEKLPGSLRASLIGSAHDAFTLGLQIAAGAGAVILFAMAIFFAWTSRRPFKSAQVQLTQGEMP
jgi:DHA2 family multidrug resistance protein-like MFS transporter